VRRWAKALRTTAYVPAAHVEVQRLLDDQLNNLFETLAADEFCARPAREVGKRLVTGGFTGEQSLSRTIEVLGQALPASSELQGVEDLAGKVVSLLGAVAGGYAAALRALTLDQQEEVSQALLRAKEDAERGLRVSEAKFRQLFTSSAVGIAISDLDGMLLETNQALREIVGDPAADLAGCSVYELFDPDDVPLLRNAHLALVGGQGTRCRLPHRLRLIDKDGEPAWTYLAVSLLHNADGEPTHHVTIVEDVTELHLLGERLAHQSLHDNLTGLPNQQFFLSSLEGVLGRAGPTARVTVCKIDLDGLAIVNDGFGREVGDQLLCSVTRRLQAVVAGEKAMVARLGSDEFAILIENSPATPGVAALAASISAELAEPADIHGHRLSISGCIGFAEHQGRGEPATLLRAAETALHGAKSRGKRQWGLFDTRRDGDHRIRCQLVAAMPEAWETGEISLRYQPLVRLIDSKVIAVEAQLRWDHPHNGPLCHHECLDLAARTGLEVPLGQWMLRSGCEQLGSWRQHFGEAIPPLYIDLTPQQSRDEDLVAGVRWALEHTGLVADCLQVGVPVVALDTEAGKAADNVRALAEMGVAIVLVGFGGVGDVAHLEDLPVRAAEIARRLAQRATQRPDGASRIARAMPDMLQMVHSCGAIGIACGIETLDDADWWRSAGADVGQGAFFAPPGPPEEIVALLGSQRSASITEVGMPGVEHS
jgi:diguanylate cyclase (GGDEF)-like protein/PAS domain S-box-containing protein